MYVNNNGRVIYNMDRKPVSCSIVFGIDENYAQHLSVALESLFQNNNYPIKVYILNSDLTDQSISKIESIAKRYNQFISFYKVDISLFKDFPEFLHISKAAYFRLLIPDLLGSNEKIALYCDADVVITGDISALFKMEIENYSLAAVGNISSFCHIQRLRLINVDTYFDAGLLLINLTFWRDHDMRNKVMRYISKNHERLLYVEQDAINSLLGRDVLEISPKFSLQSNYIKRDISDLVRFKKFGPINDIFKDVRVIQFAGSSKPWQYLNNDYYKNLYWQYIRYTPYSDCSPEGRTFKNFLRKHFYFPLKK